MFNVGDKVRIRKESRYYGQHKINNPADTTGTVTVVRPKDYHTHFKYRVTWPNPLFENSYAEDDIEFVAPAKMITEFM
jgi:hypothetical protein